MVREEYRIRVIVSGNKHFYLLVVSAAVKNYDKTVVLKHTEYFGNCHVACT